MTIQGLVLILLIGAAAGWLAGNIMKGRGFGAIGNILVGIVGAFLGGFLFALLGIRVGGVIGSLVMATVGALLLLWVVNIIKRT